MRTKGSTSNLQDLLAAAELPALPQSAVALLALAQDPDNGPAEFAIPIESDPGLTGQVLRFVNSSFFGFRQEISSVKLAISLVGVRTIKNFALWNAVFSLMPNPKCGVFDLKSLWQDSLRRGIFSRTLGKAVGLPDAEDLFAIALLQDMAIPLLARELPSQYQLLFEARQEGARRLSDLECAEFGWNHADAGGELARTWGLPEEFAVLLESHIRIDRVNPRGDAAPSSAVIVLSSMLPSLHDAQWIDGGAFAEALGFVAGADAGSLCEIFARVDNEFTEFAPLLNLASPARTLVESLRDFETAPV